MTNANENSAPLPPKTPELGSTSGSINAYYSLRDGTMSFEDAMEATNKDLRLKTDPLKLNLVREELEAAETYGDFLSIIRAQEDIKHEHDMAVLKMTGAALEDARNVKMQLDGFNEMVNDFQEMAGRHPDVDHEAIEYTMTMFREFLDSVGTAMLSHVFENLEEEKNKAVADQYEGTSEAMPDTIEELLGDTKK